MLQLKPNCETCDCDFVVDSTAYICTFECTFCDTCTENIHNHQCPNCLGNLEKRPIRPRELITKYPPFTKRVSN